MAKKKAKKKKVVKKKYCPMCGSTRVGKAAMGYQCARCTSRFPKPATHKVKLPKKPKYIQ